MDMTLFFIVSCVGLILYFHFVHPRFMQVTEDPKRDRKTSRSPATCDTQHRMKEDTQLTIPSEKHMPSRGVGRSIRGALALLFWDVVISGSFCASLLICPIWFLVSILKNLIQRPGWKIALFRIAIPAATLGLVLANNALQCRMAESNATRIITACEKYHAANGTFPQTLDDLVPQYMQSIPRAKNCMMFGEFRYWNMEESHTLEWYAVPPHCRKRYNFEGRKWNYLY